MKVTRRQALELLAVAVGVGLGIQLVGTYLAEHISDKWELLIGVAVIFSALILLLGRALVPAPRERELQGFLVYDRETGHLAEADREYDFGSRVKRFVDSAFTENRALKVGWEKKALHSGEDEKPNENYELLRQVIEYYVLANLSTHLSDYFSFAGVGKEDLYTVSRVDLPDVLLENRFMKLFTEPMAERPAWIEGESAVGDSGKSGYRIVRVNPEGDSTLVSAYHPSGAYFELFELVLPKGSQVKRVSGDTIEIDTPKFSLRVATAFRGVSTNLPFLYDSVLLGFGNEWERAAFFRADIWVRVAPKRFGLLSGRGWSYYRWIDEWLQSLEESVSQDAYLDRVGWATAEMTYRLLGGHGERQPRADDIAVDESRAGGDGKGNDAGKEAAADAE